MAPRKRTARSKAWSKASTPQRNTVSGSGNTMTNVKAFHNLTKEEKQQLDGKDYGFNHIKVPRQPLEKLLPLPKFPNNKRFAKDMMCLMQNKIFYLREYFALEAKHLIVQGVDKKKRTKAEQAMLDTAANPNELLPVTKRAQDCLRLILYYVVLFTNEKDYTEMSPEDQFDRVTNLVNRDLTWRKLREEIAEQLPGDKQFRKQCAEVVLHGALDQHTGSREVGGHDGSSEEEMATSPESASGGARKVNLRAGFWGVKPLSRAPVESSDDESSSSDYDD